MSSSQTKAKCTFIWGSGGVGKSHVALRCAARAETPTLLITLDPSQRVFELLDIPVGEGEQAPKERQINVGTHEFTIRSTDVLQLFEQLSKTKPANPQVKIFFEKMARGLQDFRNYLSLIQLADELGRSQYRSIIIDTPPFHEAMGLHRSIFSLRNFFERSLVQFALKSSMIGWVHTTLKKTFEVTRIFIGKNAAAQVFDFIEWLTSHIDRFKASAQQLEQLVYSEDTTHTFIITPETKIKFLDDVKDHFFKMQKHLSFVMNRSVNSFPLPKSEDSFSQELRVLAQREKGTIEKLRSRFPGASLESISLMLMGEDTQNELLKFIEAPSR